MGHGIGSLRCRPVSSTTRSNRCRVVHDRPQKVRWKRRGWLILRDLELFLWWRNTLIAAMIHSTVLDTGTESCVRVITVPRRAVPRVHGKHGQAEVPPRAPLSFKTRSARRGRAAYAPRTVT